MYALGAKSYLQKHKYIIPSDVAMSCMSGTALCELVHPTITSVEQLVESMAKEATRLLINKLNNPLSLDETVVLDSEMIIRESTNCKHKG